MSTPITENEAPFDGEVVSVLCDGSGRVGALSYRVPETLSVTPGDAVEVPFGKRQLHGLVLGPGDPALATREILNVHGKRVSAEELELAGKIANLHFSDLPVVAARLSPRSGRGAQALDAGIVVPQPLELALPEVDEAVKRRLYLRAPVISGPEVAALEAYRLSRLGQVLVLCPTVDSVTKTLALFQSGAARLDTKALKGAWKGFTEGTVTIGIGTRAAALYSAADLAGIIVVDEDHPAHFEAAQPYTNARDIADLRSRHSGAALTLISANPTTSAIGADVKVSSIGGKDDWPRVRILDRGEFHPDDRPAPGPLRRAISDAVAKRQKVFVLCETRKASRRCAKCSSVRACLICESSNCQHQETDPCPKCGTFNVRMLGWDKERIIHLLGEEVKPVTMTELSEKVDTSALVVIFDIDPALNMPSLTPESLASHIIVSGARAAGRKGALLVITTQPQHPALVDLCINQDQLKLARRAWELSKSAQLPPFGRLVTIKVGRTHAPSVNGAPGRVLGPRKTADGWEVLIRCTNDEMPKLAKYIERVRRPGKVRVVVL